jgi:hypothetical protein
METSGRFFGLLTETADWLPWRILLFWGVLFLVAWAARSRGLRFAAFFMLLGPLPLAFVPPRGPAQYYVCWFGWTLYGAIAIAGLAEHLTRDARPANSWAARERYAVLLVALALTMYPQFKRRVPPDMAAASVGAPENLDYAQQLRRIEPRFAPRSRLLFLNDPYPANWWNLLFLVRLSYHDSSLDVKRVKQGEETPGAERFASYDYVFDYRDGRFSELKRPAR